MNASLDPGLQAGISFETGDFQMLGEGEFHPTQVNTMPVVHLDNGKAQPLGTCFVVANEGLAITARHVVEEAFGRFLQLRKPHAEIPADQNLCAVYSSNVKDPDTGHFVGGPLLIVKIWFNSLVDIAILQLSVPTDTRTGNKLYLPAVSLSPGIPKVGEYIFGFGYHSMKPWEEIEGGQLVDQRYSASRGLVEQIHFPQRDRVFMSFPCFQTSAQFKGGMSGGPIISQSGQVCGVICSSIETDESDGTYTSYGSLIAPALALVLRGKDGSGIERDLFLHDFVKGGAVSVDETANAITVQNNGNEIVVDLGEDRRFRNQI